MRIRNFLFLFAIGICKFTFIFANTTSDFLERQELLLKKLFSKYNKRLIPRPYEDQPLAISGTMLGANLVEIQESKQLASYVATRRQNWTDFRLTWNPADYGGIKSILVPAGDVWRHDIFTYNSVKFDNLLAEYKDWAKIEYNGMVQITIPQYVEATCKIYVHRFPFDTQYCTMSLSSNQMESDQFDFWPVPIDYTSDRFVGNSEWTIENALIFSEVKTEVGVWGAKGDKYKYIFQLKRRPTYYVSVIVIPTFLITAVSIVGIYAPGTEHEPGDVANLGLGTLLALMVLLGIISDKLPKSEEMSLLGFHVLVILVAFCCCILFEMSSLYYFQKMEKSGQKPPQWLYKIAFFEQFFKKSQKNSSKGKIAPSQRSSIASFQLENGISMKSHLENGGIKRTPSDITRSNSPIKKFLTNEKQNLKKWQHIIGELKNKSDEEQQKLKEEWGRIETRLDFIWIFIFESFNICNLFSLIWFARLPAPDMKDWL